MKEKSSEYLAIASPVIVLAIVLVIGKLFNWSFFSGVPWVVILSPYWFTLGIINAHNASIQFGTKIWSKLFRIAILITLVLLIVRLTGLVEKEYLPWWKVTFPYWAYAIFVAAVRRYQEYGTYPIVLSWKGLLLIALPPLLKLIGIPYLDKVYWFWLSIPTIYLVSGLIINNTIIECGERFKRPFVFVSAISILILYAVIYIFGFDHNTLWLSFVPVVAYSFFCLTVVRPAIRDVRKKTAKRNDIVFEHQNPELQNNDADHPSDSAIESTERSTHIDPKNVRDQIGKPREFVARPIIPDGTESTIILPLIFSMISAMVWTGLIGFLFSKSILSIYPLVKSFHLILRFALFLLTLGLLVYLIIPLAIRPVAFLLAKSKCRMRWLWWTICAISSLSFFVFFFYAFNNSFLDIAQLFIELDMLFLFYSIFFFLILILISGAWMGLVKMWQRIKSEE